MQKQNVKKNIFDQTYLFDITYDTNFEIRKFTIFEMFLCTYNLSSEIILHCSC